VFKCRVTYATGCAPNIPWWRCLTVSDTEISAYNSGFLRRETVEFIYDQNANAGNIELMPENIDPRPEPLL
jgi:hypothetical protein